MLIWFRYGVILSAVLCLSLLIYLIFKSFSFGTPELNAPPSGSQKKGILFAFGRGMMPWEKESAKKHLITYGAGIVYHMGIFAALLYLFLDLFSIKTPFFVINIFMVLMASAVVCGLGLLFKRSVLKYMRAISSPDDFVSNLLVELFLILSLFHAFGFPVRIFWYGAAAFLFLYIPMGKIRHCFFFFYARILFGSFYGRRGVYPPRQPSSFE
jgi:hypothetical protein